MRRRARLPACRTLQRSQPGYPRALAALPNPPDRVRVCGQLPGLEDAVAVVGTRYADEDGLEFARALGAALAGAGRPVISGGARGIDAAAHRGALDAGGATLAVLANGFRPFYPPEHAGLFAEIAAQGALLSERDDGEPPVRFSFLARNRLIAALAPTLVVVQAPLRSGALSTAAVATRLGKQVFAVPYAPWDARGEGCLGLLRRGSRICTSPRDVLSLPPHGVEPEAGGAWREGARRINVDALDREERVVLEALRRQPRHPDELGTALHLPVMTIQRVLLQLVLKGAAVERPPGRYVRTRDSEPR